MPGIPPAIEVDPVHHLPIIKADADQRGLVGRIKHYVPTEMDVDAGTVVLGLVWDRLGGRSPLYRLEEFFAHQDTEFLVGQALPLQAITDETVGRALARLYDFGTMKLLTACAVRAVMRFGLERRYGPFDTTSRSVWGESQCAEEQDLPFQVTDGYSKEKRPDLTQFVLATLCVDRAVPMWGKTEDGKASDKALNTTLLAEIAQLLARYGVQPGAYRYVADAALVTADNLAALGDTWGITRLPATESACGRVIGEAVGRNQGEEAGGLAQTPPTTHRPGTTYKVAADVVTLYGKTYRAVVVHSRSQDQRRQKRLERELQASYATLEATVRALAKQRDCCRADAEAAAQKLRALPSAYHQVDVVLEQCPQYGPGRPRQHQPRPINALTYRLRPTLRAQTEVILHKSQEAACFVVLTPVPRQKAMAQSAREVLHADKNQPGVEQNFAFLKAPLLVNRLCLKKPERIEALGLVLLLALLLGRLMERALRVHVETTGSTLVGWDQKETQKPTVVMMMTKGAAVIVVKVGTQRQLAPPLSTVQPHYRTALGVPTAYCTASHRS